MAVQNVYRQTKQKILSFIFTVFWSCVILLEKQYLVFFFFFSLSFSCFQRARVFCMGLQPAADPYNIVHTY